ncbi:hypothetical protein DIS09_20980 [Burkholderia pseudomallei]|uniref:hypothetical protein n=1 Tax=Burkholderia pseudomallei TaxID=28450 RepID=UPI000978984C|nr:hypothetical protein [Burkholderia pseudomallei]MBF3482708.1 hypothetical protein [Burkholderia pseudomallei]MXK60115.1 hypothetical protein [Burkholderia pseudomallei]MXN60251.1 hypothetical protein [Burkholderia pseudomallei]PNW97396.1 hypothetical protein CF641_32030 [Burkholderia pseudomallei]PNX40363.1 hypothetical protein CF642_18100 [Burkholderia pseudomallei]
MALAQPGCRPGSLPKGGARRRASFRAAGPTFARAMRARGAAALEAGRRAASRFAMRPDISDDRKMILSIGYFRFCF